MSLLFNSGAHKTATSGLDALWVKQQAIADNIANYETPGYKAKVVSFQEELTKSVNEKTGRSEKNITTRVKIDSSTDSSIRSDGNNVDMEKEQLELWKTYAQYNYLSKKVSGDFKNMRYVINQLGR